MYLATNNNQTLRIKKTNKQMKVMHEVVLNTLSVNDKEYTFGYTYNMGAKILLKII